jgi:thioredoxin reductase (NADPH)
VLRGLDYGESMSSKLDFEAIVVGGGAAGLSAALVLGRARRRTLVLDDGEPSNAPAHAIGGLLGQDGTAPLELLEAGHAQLAELPTVELREATASDVRAGADSVEVDGVRAEALLLATGMHYRRPELPGLEQLWGDTVFHCPFCHGWELRERPLAVLAAGDHAPVMARLLRGWSEDVVLLSDPGELKPEAAAALDAAGIPIDGRAVRGLRARGRKLEAVLFDDGELARDGLLLQAVPEPRGTLLDELGLERNGAGAVAIDSMGKTSVPRVWAAGDLTPGPQSVAVAIATGHRAAVGIVQALLVAP